MNPGRLLLKYAVLMGHLVLNRWAWLHHTLGQTYSHNGSAHRRFSVDRSLTYIDGIFRRYLEHAELDSKSLQGKCVLEIGPGDNLGVALRFLAAGAAQTVSVDRFYSHRDPEREQEIYLALRHSLDPEERKRFDDAIDLRDGISFNPKRLRYLYGKGIEEYRAELGQGFAGVIVSCAVLEEIEDLDIVFSNLDYFLAPGGVQAHIIDLRDYSMLSRYGFHPLEFCTIPDTLYRYASKFSRPNRLRADYYRKKMDEFGYDAWFAITHVCGRKAALDPPRTSLIPGVDFTAAEIAQLDVIRPRLLESYRALSNEDLLTMGFVLAAHKPARPRGAPSQFTAESAMPGR